MPEPCGGHWCSDSAASEAALSREAACRETAPSARPGAVSRRWEVPWACARWRSRLRSPGHGRGRAAAGGDGARLPVGRCRSGLARFQVCPFQQSVVFQLSHLDYLCRSQLCLPCCLPDAPVRVGSECCAAWSSGGGVVSAARFHWALAFCKRSL